MQIDIVNNFLKNIFFRGIGMQIDI